MWNTLSLRRFCATQTVAETFPSVYFRVNVLEKHLGQYTNVHELPSKLGTKMRLWGMPRKIERIARRPRWTAWKPWEGAENHPECKSQQVWEEESIKHLKHSQENMYSDSLRCFCCSCSVNKYQFLAKSIRFTTFIQIYTFQRVQLEVLLLLSLILFPS